MPNDTAAVAAEPTSKSPLPQPAPTGQAPEFPGCHTIPLKREDLLDYDGRFEYWDADTETARVVSEPTSATVPPMFRTAAGGACPRLSQPAWRAFDSSISRMFFSTS